MTRASTTTELLARLVAIDTTSSRSNAPLLDYVEDYLCQHGVSSRRVTRAEDGKANLFATIGPDASGGIILSGHTDCVPVTGQNWATDPFTLTERDGRLYGRGTSDMKGFLASALSIVPDIVAKPRSRPVHLAFSYDEEVGCAGVVDLLDDLAARKLTPDLCLVGEPTEMGLAIGHKSGRAYRCSVKGLEAHSSLTPQGVNAIDAAAKLILEIGDIGRGFAFGIQDDAFDVAHATISVGMIEGGTGINIVPNHCSFVFEYRLLYGQDPEAVFERVKRMADYDLLPGMRAVFEGSDIRFEKLYNYPAHRIESDHSIVGQVGNILGSQHLSKVAFGTEAGLFQNALGVPTVICGPGQISVAHKPDEFVTQIQLDKSDKFLRDLCAFYA